MLLTAVRGIPGAALLAPAHVSLGYPWLPAPAALEQLPRVAAAAGAVPAFRAVLTGPYVFDPDPRGRVLVHARLSDETPVRALADRLGAGLRDVHLSLARVLPTGSVAAVRAALDGLLPLEADVGVLELTVQQGGRWTRALLAPLGGPARGSGAG